MPAMVLQSQPATVSVQFTDTAGSPANPGTVTVDVANLAGTALVTDAATTGSGTSPRVYTLSSSLTATLDTLALTFDSDDASIANVIETVEVIGNHLFTITEARAFDGAAMTSTVTYPTATIAEARARITDQFEAICGVSFVPRYRLDDLNGTGETSLILPRMQITDIRSVSTRDAGGATWTAYDADDLADLYYESWGYLLRETRGTFLSGRKNVRIGYEHGYAQVPWDIKRAALMTLRYELVDSNYSDRTISIANEFGSTQFWTPGVSGRGSAIHPLPEVDRILRLYMNRVPVVA